MEIMERNGVSTTKKEPNYRGIKAMPFVIGNETFEKLGTTGTSANLIVYLTTVFNMNSITAVNLINVFNGTCNLGTLLGAFASDTYLGRYKTLGIASVSSFLGMLLLTLTAVFPSLHPPECGSGTCIRASPLQLTFLFSSFVLLIIGASGIRPCNLAFGADQFNPNTESGKRGINSFFNWYYFTFTFAMMISLTIIVYVQSDISWAIGLGIPAFLMFLSCAFFFVGTKMYVKVMPQGSPITSVIQTLVVAFKKRKLELPEQPSSKLFNHIPDDYINSKLTYTDELRFLNKGAILTTEDEINPDGSAKNPWNLRSLQQVEEIKCVIRVIPIWISGIIYYVVLNQMQTYVVLQAIQTDRRIGRMGFKIPAASYGVITMISLSLWIPLYDRVIVPLLTRFTKKEGGITMLQRMGIGFVFAVITMLVSGLVENRRRELGLNRPLMGPGSHNGAISSMSGNWLIPQLAIVGVSEAFTIIGEVEFLYKQFPENMRSFAGSFLFCGLAVATYSNSLLISVVNKMSNWLVQDLNKGRLDYFYYFVAGLEVVNLGYFLVCTKWYRYKTSDQESNMKDVALEKIDHQKPLV